MQVVEQAEKQDKKHLIENHQIFSVLISAKIDCFIGMLVKS